jgi:primary-amine oxidase
MWLRDPVAYPLDPLSGDEFTAVASIMQREHGVGDGGRCASIELIEPSKAELREFDGLGAPPPRHANATGCCGHTPMTRPPGITDMDLVFFDTWTYGNAVAPPEYRDRRIDWSDTWCRYSIGGSPYANLVSGLHCVIDLNAMELLRVEDSGPFSGTGVEKPEGPSFTLDGNLLRWQNWSLRIGFNRALPGLLGGPLPAHRLRHRRVGSRVDDHVAGVGLC